jgi:transport and Golgi organization protein 2
MCTVTYLPLNNKDFILTSSRDVPFSREKSSFPKKYTEDKVELFYPKDGRAGGTWIGTSDKRRLICLLNGGFKNHQQKVFYEKSRGIIVKDLLKAENITEVCKQVNLKNVEPFTLVIIEWNKPIDKIGSELVLIEFVWDGKKKHFKTLEQKPRIWSSSTLYSDGMKEKRVEWFLDWRQKQPFTQKSILEFHHKAGVGNPKIDVLMKRPKVGTVSITQVSKIDGDITMDYEQIK